MQDEKFVLEENIYQIIIKQNEQTWKIKWYKKRIWESLFFLLLNDDLEKVNTEIANKLNYNDLIILENLDLELKDYPNLFKTLKEYKEKTKKVIINCSNEKIEEFNKKIKFKTNRMSFTYLLSKEDLFKKDSTNKIIINQIRKFFKYPIQIFIIDFLLSDYLYQNIDKLKILFVNMKENNKSLIFDSRNLSTRQIMKIYKISKEYWIDVYFQNI